MKRVIKNNVLIAKYTDSGIKLKTFHEESETICACQPPKNKRAVTAAIKIILLYSARKNKANPIAEYSTLYPETNSASASGKSKGCRLVSAKAVTKKIENTGNNGSPNQIEL